MRLDLFLKVSRLIPRRSLAQEFCDSNRIKVNGMPAKSSKEIKANDEIEIRRKNRVSRVSVLEVPAKKQMSKEGAETLYKLISEETTQDSDLLA